MSQSPLTPQTLQPEHPYAQAAAQLNKLIRAGKSFSGHERNCFFLNVAGSSFANASAISGFDFDDDARAVAKCDWDFDGDLDLWVANRTAPQVRFLQNKMGSQRHFIALRLIGRQSNRDAIGAQVLLTVVNGDRSATLRGSVRAEKVTWAKAPSGSTLDWATGRRFKGWRFVGPVEDSNNSSLLRDSITALNSQKGPERVKLGRLRNPLVLSAANRSLCRPAVWPLTTA